MILKTTITMTQQQIKEAAKEYVNDLWVNKMGTSHSDSFIAGANYVISNAHVWRRPDKGDVPEDIRDVAMYEQGCALAKGFYDKNKGTWHQYDDIYEKYLISYAPLLWTELIKPPEELVEQALKEIKEMGAAKGSDRP